MAPKLALLTLPGLGLPVRPTTEGNTHCSGYMFTNQVYFVRTYHVQTVPHTLISSISLLPFSPFTLEPAHFRPNRAMDSG